MGENTGCAWKIWVDALFFFAVVRLILFFSFFFGMLVLNVNGMTVIIPPTALNRPICTAEHDILLRNNNSDKKKRHTQQPW